MADSSERRVGLSERPYSNPARVWPTASCLKVELIWIGGTTAPGDRIWLPAGVDDRGLEVVSHAVRRGAR